MRTSRGFTLIELLVSISIMAMLLAFAVANFRDFQGRQDLDQAAQTLKTNLRFAQSEAFGGVKRPTCAGTSPSPTLVGWYIRLETVSSYGIYARCVGLAREQYRVVLLPSGVTMTITSNANILFQPVSKDVLFGNADSDPPTSVVAQADITLTKGSQTKTIMLQSTGDIL